MEKNQGEADLKGVEGSVAEVVVSSGHSARPIVRVQLRFVTETSCIR